MRLHIFFNNKVKPICNGTAGVNGPAQKAHIIPNAVHHHGFTINAKRAVTMQGDQKISSAIIK